MTGSWSQSFCSSVRIQIHGLSGYLLLQFQSYSFNILYDVYTHNGGGLVYNFLWSGGGIIFVFILKKSLLTKELSIIINCGGILLFQFLKCTTNHSLRNNLFNKIILNKPDFIEEIPLNKIKLLLNANSELQKQDSQETL